MKEKRKPSPRLVLALILVAVMILSTVSLFLFFVHTYIAPLTPYHSERRGMENWYCRDFFEEDHGHGQNEETTFLNSYLPADADYYWDYYVYALAINDVNRSLAWIAYDDPAVYAAAKQSRLDYIAEQTEPLTETEAFGFRFCSFDDIMTVNKGRGGKTAKRDYEAFGYNDDALTLIFLDFDARGSKQNRYMKLANTDYAAFLTHYYNDWFDWENGVGIHLPE